MDAGETFTYDVAAACSGIRSLMTLVPLTLAFAFINYRAWWRRLFLMLLSVPFAVAGNTLRILIVIWIGNRFGQEVGLDWEQKLGLITFPIIAGIFLVDIWLREPSSMPDKKRSRWEWGHESAILSDVGMRRSGGFRFRLLSPLLAIKPGHGFSRSDP